MGDHAKIKLDDTAKQIISVAEDHSLKFDEEALREILSKDDVKDLELAVISVGGTFRKGKSFLLNFFLKYLQSQCGKGTVALELQIRILYEYGPKKSSYLQDKENWMDSGEKPFELNGFHWRGGSKGDTNGILVWPKVFVFDFPGRNKKVGVLLMDTQGTCDPSQTTEDDVKVFGLSTLISSVQIFNVSSNIDGKDLEYLQFFAEYGRLVKNACQDEKPFQNLLFLVRDWSYPDEHEYGYEGGCEFVQSRLQVIAGQSEELTKVREHIKSCFTYHSGFLMPHPGLTVAQYSPNSKFKIKMSDIEQEFMDHMDVFVSSLFDPMNLVAKRTGGRKIKAEELVDYFKLYFEKFSSNELPKPLSLYEASVEAHHLAAYRDAKEVYRKTMKKMCGEGKPYIWSSDLTGEHKSAIIEAIKTFTEGTKLGDKELSKTYMEKLKEALKNDFNGFRNVNREKSFIKTMVNDGWDAVNAFIDELIERWNKFIEQCKNAANVTFNAFLETLDNSTIRDDLEDLLSGVTTDAGARLQVSIWGALYNLSRAGFSFREGSVHKIGAPP